MQVEADEGRQYAEENGSVHTYTHMQTRARLQELARWCTRTRTLVRKRHARKHVCTRQHMHACARWQRLFSFRRWCVFVCVVFLFSTPVFNTLPSPFPLSHTLAESCLLRLCSCVLRPTLSLSLSLSLSLFFSFLLLFRSHGSMLIKVSTACTLSDCTFPNEISTA